MEVQLEGQVLDFVVRNGPSLPIQVSKAIGRDMLFAGAILSQLSSKKSLMVSSAKVGGSPLYYVKGQEVKLSILYKHLPFKEQEAYNLLKENKILMDNLQEPSIRVALRALKDFAVPFKAEVEGKEEWFWRWRTATDEEISNLFNQKEEQETIAPIEVQVQPVQQVREQGEVIYRPVQTQQPLLERRKIQIEVGDDRRVQVDKIEIKEKVGLKIERPKVEKSKVEPNSKIAEEDEFLEDAASYLENNDMEILEETVVKKNRESHFIVVIPSNIGDLEYFVVARNKKKISDGDISLAYNEGQKKKLPVLFLSPGELTKKAEKYIEDNLKGFVVFKRIE